MIKFKLPSKASAESNPLLSNPQLIAAPMTHYPAGYAEAKAACLAKCTLERKVIGGFTKYAVSMPELRAAYPRELKVFYKIRERANGSTRVLCDDWKGGHRAFARFLGEVGPSPGSDWKLRRIEQSEPLYAQHTLHWVKHGSPNDCSHDDLAQKNRRRFAAIADLKFKTAPQPRKRRSTPEIEHGGDRHKGQRHAN